VTLALPGECVVASLPSDHHVQQKHVPTCVLLPACLSDCCTVGERALERAGERTIERASERALERAGEAGVTCAVLLLCCLEDVE
jgi:hypothetical protein